MKKILNLFLVLIFLCSVVSAAEITGQVGKKVEITMNAEGDLVIGVAKARSADELEKEVSDKKQELDMERAGKSREEKDVLSKQNAVRLAVHSFLAMEDLIGGIGKQVSEIAREFDNSAEKTIEAENQINERGSLKRLFMGGDAKAADEIEEEVKANMARIELMKKLKEECGSEVKAMFVENINNMEAEFARLLELAEKEKQNRGLFGWLFK